MGIDMRIDWHFVGLFLLFLLFCISMANASVLVEQGAYFNRYYDSATGRYTLQTYGKTINVFEDGKWKPIEKARSLKGIWQVKVLKSDANFPLEVLDFNSTHIKVNISSAVTGTIPFQWCRDVCSDSDCSLTTTQCNNVTVAVTTASRNKFQAFTIAIPSATDFNNITWGTASTTIQINNGNLTDDTYVYIGDTARSNTSYGPATNLRIANQTTAVSIRTTIKANISAVPDGSTIESAVSALTISGNALDAAENWTVGAFHVYNSSGGYTINGVDWIEGVNAPGGSGCTQVGGANETASMTGYNYPSASSQMNLTAESYTLISNSTDHPVGTVIVFNITNMFALEFATNACSNCKNLTIHYRAVSTGGSPNTLDCIAFNSSEAATGKPYLNITYTEGGGAPAIPQVINVSLKSPSNNTWNTSQTINFGYLPIWQNETIANCSLFTNRTGSWAYTAANASAITNNTASTITYNFAADYNEVLWNVYCYGADISNSSLVNFTIKIDTTAPSAPTITVASSGETWINVNIGSCTDAGSGVEKKLLYRNGTNIINFTSESTYNDTGLTGCGTAYSYLLGCLDNVGWYGSNSTQLDTNTNHSTIPSTPANLHNETISDTCIDLDWDDCTATDCTIDTYRIFRNDTLAGTNTTSFFNECGLTNCTSYGYTVDVNDSGGLWSANSSTFIFNTTGCYAADRSPPNVTLVSPANWTNQTTAIVTFACNATSNNTLANASLYLNVTGSWLLNETKTTSETSNTATFTKTFSNGSYLWNCEWCNTYNNCSFALANWTVDVNVTPSAGGVTLLLLIQDIGGDDSMIGVIVTGLMVFVFVYLHVHQEDQAWKLGYLIMAIIMMSVTIVLAILELSISERGITSSQYDSATGIMTYTRSNVTDTSPQRAVLASLLNPLNWIYYLIIAIVLIGVLIKVAEYATTKRR